MKEKIVVLGTGAHSKVVLDIVESADHFEIAGVVSGDPEAPDAVRGHPFLGGFEVLSDLCNQGVQHAAIGIGGWTDNTFREEVFRMAKTAGFLLPPLMHPSAIVAPDVPIGEGSMVGPGAIIETEATIGRNVIVSCASLVAHETRVDDHVLISGAAKIGSHVELRRGSVIAFGATVVSRLVVGEEALVAAGAVVVDHVPSGNWVYGVPARTRKTTPTDGSRSA